MMPDTIRCPGKEAECSIPGQLDALHGRVVRIEEAQAAMAVSMEDNTTITRGIARQLEVMLPRLEEMHSEYKAVYVPAKTTGSVMTKVIKWGGGVGLGLTGIGGVVVGIWHWIKGQ